LRLSTNRSEAKRKGEKGEKTRGISEANWEKRKRDKWEGAWERVKRSLNSPRKSNLLGIYRLSDGPERGTKR